MEFNEKLQLLRRRRGLTQEELAEAMYVSRTAVSKWESGRGYPNITSLKALAGFFSVTVDELISSDDGLAVVSGTVRRNWDMKCGYLFGILDICAVMLLFLPIYRFDVGGSICSVMLSVFEGSGEYTRFVYYIAIIGTTFFGALSTVLQGLKVGNVTKLISMFSLCIGCGLLLVFIVSGQPYAATVAFLFLVGKVFLLIKER